MRKPKSIYSPKPQHKSIDGLTAEAESTMGAISRELGKIIQEKSVSTPDGSKTFPLEPEGILLRFFEVAKPELITGNYWRLVGKALKELLPMCKWGDRLFKYGEAPWEALCVRDYADFKKHYLDPLFGPFFDVQDFIKEFEQDETAASQQLETLARTHAAKAQALAVEVDPLAVHGGDRRTKPQEQADNSVNIRMNEVYGTSSSYRTAKLKRDHPEIAERMADGEFNSVADAERAAGIRPPKVRRVRVELAGDPVDIAEKITANLDRDKLAQLVAILTQHLSED